MGKKTKNKKSAKRFIAIITIFVMLINLMPVGMVKAYAATWSGSVATGYAGGDGSSGSPYQIATGEQLAYLASVINSSAADAPALSANYSLTADIDLNNLPWTPISNGNAYNKQFSGVFNGNGHTISNLSIGTSSIPNTTCGGAGLFQVVYGGTIKNVGILNSKIFLDFNGGSAGSLVAALTGDPTHISTITNCYGTGTISNISSNGTIGGLVGSCMYGNVTKCYTTGSLLCGDQAVVGGLVGQCQASSVITSCYSTATTIATSGSYASSGGLVGWMSEGTASVVNSYATGNVTGGNTTYIGGLVGDYAKGTITNCFYNSSATQSVSGVAQTVKGVGDLGDTTTPKTLIEMKDADFVTTLNTGYTGTWTTDAGTNNQGFPVLSGVTAVSLAMYKITYDGNGNTAGIVPIDTGAYADSASVSLSANTGSLLKTGATFNGWNTQADGLGTNYNACAAYTMTGNTTLYATWAASAGAPIVSLSTTASSTNNASPIPITVSFNKSVTGFDMGDITVSNGTKSNFIGSGDTYSFDITPTVDGSITVDVAAGVAKDSSNQDNLEATRLTLISDRTAPSVTISTSNSVTKYSPILVFIAFSEGVTGFTEDDITVTNGTKGTVSGSVMGYSLNITPTGQGAVTVNVAAGGAIDAAGNSNTAATEYIITYDSIGPTVAITSTASEPIHSSPIPVAITFSEVVTGFTVDDIEVGNGTKSGFSGSGTTYTVNITPTNEGWVSVDIFTNSVRDVAGNNNPLAAQLLRRYTATAATVTTQAVTAISSTTATGNGNITDLGVLNPTQYGVVWSTTANPTTALATKTEQGAVSATGAFTSSITGLTVGTTYYVRAYATNAGGTSYGSEVMFTTSALVPTTTVTRAAFWYDSGFSDSDFITKTALQTIVGTLSANLQSTEMVEVSLDGGSNWTLATISPGTSAWQLINQTLGEGNNTLKVHVKNDSGGIGPTFSQAYVLDTAAPAVSAPDLITASDTGSDSTDNITEDTTPTFSGTAEAGSTVKLYDTDGTSLLGSANATGGGTWSITSMTLSSGNHAITAKAEDAAGNISAASSPLVVTILANVAPTVTTQAVSGITTTTATGNGNLANLGTSNPTQYGVVWSTSANPTTALTTKTTQGSASSTGAFTSSITGLTAGTTYHVRTYATNTAGTSYGNDVTFTTGENPPTTTVTSGAFSADTGLSNTDFITKTAAQTIRGTLSANIGSGESVMVSLNNGGSWTAAVSSVGSNAWSLSSQTLTSSDTLKVKVVNGGGDGTVWAQAYVLDTSAPTVTISSTPSNPIRTSPIPVTVTFSESVTGFTATSIGVTNGTAGTLSGSDTTYSLGITPSAVGVVTVDIAAGVAQDTAGNDNTAAAQLSRTYAYATSTVTTQAVTMITDVTATGNGTITSFGATRPTRYGVVWGTSPNPDTSLTTKTDLGTASRLGAYTCNMYGLTSGTTYHLRAYATNDAGTTYGDDVTFTTLESQPTTWITSVVFSEDTGISNTDLVTKTAAQTINGTLSKALKPGESVMISLNNGGSWTAATCPVGSNTWSLLGQTLISSNTLKVKVSNSKGDGTVLSQSYFLNTTAPTVRIYSSATNPTSISPIPVDIMFSSVINDFTVSDITVTNGTKGALVGSAGAYSLEITPSGAGVVTVDIAAGVVQNTAGNNNTAAIQFSRMFGYVAPTVTTQAVSEISTTTATGNGNITSLGVPNPTQYGVVWGTSANPDVSLTTKTTQGTASGTGAFTSSITGLTAGTTYHVRAYATNATGTSYGNDVTFTTTLAPTAPVITVNDTTNKLVGAYATMEYSTDGGLSWTTYNPLSEPTFTGNITVKIRVKASGSVVAGAITTVVFTVNPSTGGGTGGSGSSGGSGGGNSSGSTTTTGTTSGTATPAAKTETVIIDVKNGSTENAVSKIIVERTMDVTGSKTDTVTYQPEKATETIAKLVAEGNSVARIEIPDLKSEVSKTIVNIPSKTLNVLSDGNINLQIDTQDAKIDISKEALDSVNNKVGNNLYFDLVPVDAGKINEVSNRAKFEVGLLKGNTEAATSIIGTPVTIETNMPSTAVDITLPLTGVDLPIDAAAREAFLKQLGVFIEHSDGSKELVQGKIVEYANGKLGIKFSIKKFSTFTIVKMDVLKKSTDCSIKTVITPKNATIKGQNITATVTKENASIVVNLTTSDKATWKLCSDKSGKKMLAGNKLKLKSGVNQAYIFVTAEDGKTTKVYSLKITRAVKKEKIKKS